jgi:hypothetical protein
MSRWYGLPLVGLIVLIVAASAAAKPVQITIDDRTGDAPNPQLDIREATLSYDRAAGTLDGVLALGAEPTYQVASSVTLYLGRYSHDDGRCYPTYEADITIPTPEDVQNGFPFPFAELYVKGSTHAIGFLPTLTRGPTISFTTKDAQAPVIEALKRGRFACAALWSIQANTFKLVDQTAKVALLGGPHPRCRVSTHRVSGGQSVPIRCKHAGRRLTVRLYKRGSKTYFSGRENVRGGRLRVPTTASMRGTWRITLWKGDVVIAAFNDIKVG